MRSRSRGSFLYSRRVLASLAGAWTLVLAFNALLLIAGTARGDDLPKSRWQMLPLSALFYTNVGGEKIVTAGVDIPCGASPLGALLVERADKLFVAAVASRPLAACAKLPQRQYFRMPFVDAKAYKVIEPMRGDLDGMRVAELPVRSLKTTVLHPSVDVEVPCGSVAGGILVMPAARKSYRIAALGFKLPARQAAAKCRGAGISLAQSSPRGVAQKIALKGLQREFSYRVLQSKVTDLKKLGVLQLRGIDSMAFKNGDATIKFRRKCFEVPVGVAVVPKGTRQALAVVVARYVNAPCVTRTANVAKSPSMRGILTLRGGGMAGEWDLAQLRQTTVLSQSDVNRFALGQLKTIRTSAQRPAGGVLTAARRDDVQGLVIAVSKHQSRGFIKSGWFVFSSRSENSAGQFALRAASAGRFARAGANQLTALTDRDLRGFARHMAQSAGAPANVIGQRPANLRISSAF